MAARMDIDDRAGPPAPADRPRLDRRRAWLIGTVVSALVAVVALVGAAVIVSKVRSGSGGTPAVVTAAPTSAAPSATTGAAASASVPAPTATGPAAPPAAFAYQPLWPFADLAAVTAWQAAYRSGGEQPWRLDADATALAFTTDYLGFDDVDTVAWHSIEAREALVAVGSAIDGQAPTTAAVLHLARFGSGQDAPWEVVGTKDSTLTLTTPAYGARVASPLTAGGRVTGVDESLLVQVFDIAKTGPVGRAAPVPAGGENTPWTTRVAFDGDTSSTLTVVVSTGGHRAAVERFAITGVRR